jgi:hypothetical protein
MNKLNIILLGATIGFVLICATSCTKEYIGEQKIVSDCDTVSVKYSVQIKTIMDAHCVNGCHNATDLASGLDLSTYAVLKAAINSGTPIKERMNDTQFPMPASGKIAACKIKTIEKWIREGALNN